MATPEDVVTAFDDIFYLARSAAPGGPGPEIRGKVAERIDRFLSALAEAPSRFGWSDDEVKKRRERLHQRLVDHARGIGALAEQKAVFAEALSALDEKPAG